MEAAPLADRVSWWSSRKCLEYYNAAVCGEAVDGNSAGPRRKLAQTYPGRVFERAVSVGCGPGGKEQALLHAGTVLRFDLFEVNRACVAAGELEAQRSGLGERASYSLAPALKTPRTPRYDLVYWDHALHHMRDVEDALRWSVAVLNPGGVILINDYIGPNRLQFPNDEVDAANAFLDRYRMEVPRLERSNLFTRLRQWKRDPSEAPDSERIPEAMDKVLGVEPAPIGGVFLNLLAGSIVPFKDEDDPAIDDMIALDASWRDRGRSHFAFGLWEKA